VVFSSVVVAAQEELTVFIAANKVVVVSVIKLPKHLKAYLAVSPYRRYSYSS